MALLGAMISVAWGMWSVETYTAGAFGKLTADEVVGALLGAIIAKLLPSEGSR
jgi:hypothetical protein